MRAIAATSRRLEEMVKEGRFREDLYYRLNVVTIHIPALRERREDIPLLTAHFLKNFSGQHNKELTIDPQLMDFLESFTWPGNVRQLHNVVENMVVLSRGENLTLENLPASLEVDPLLESGRFCVRHNVAGRFAAVGSREGAWSNATATAPVLPNRSESRSAPAAEVKSLGIGKIANPEHQFHAAHDGNGNGLYNI